MFKRTKTNFKVLPTHVAFILDGNGRWAQRRGLTRVAGHKAGVIACKATVQNCFDLGIKVVSFYAFSTENWKRPQKEVDAIFSLVRDFVKTDLQEIYKYDAKVVVSGDYTKFPADLVEALEECLEKTKNGKTFILNLCINYGGRDEIVRAVNSIIKSKVESVNEESFSKFLYTADLPDPDFIIRTSGEQRISNYMLWQCAYSEFYFPKVYWPDFDKQELIKALNEYGKRNRRFGNIKENKWKQEY